VGELMDVPVTKGKSALWNERTRENEEGALQNWLDDGRQSERVKHSLLFVFFFSIIFFISFIFLSLRMLHGRRAAMEGLKGRMEVCVFEESELAFAPSLFAWNRTNESKNVFSLVLTTTIYKHYI
jgi:hypothetical protein